MKNSVECFFPPHVLRWSCIFFFFAASLYGKLHWSILKFESTFHSRNTFHLIMIYSYFYTWQGFDLSMVWQEVLVLCSLWILFVIFQKCCCLVLRSGQCCLHEMRWKVSFAFVFSWRVCVELLLFTPEIVGNHPRKNSSFCEKV